MTFDGLIHVLPQRTSYIYRMLLRRRRKTNEEYRVGYYHSRASVDAYAKIKLDVSDQSLQYRRLQIFAIGKDKKTREPSVA